MWYWNEHQTGTNTILKYLCVIITATVGVDSCGIIGIPYVVNKLSVTNYDDGRTIIKDYSTEGNENLWLI